MQPVSRAYFSNNSAEVYHPNGNFSARSEPSGQCPYYLAARGFHQDVRTIQSDDVWKLVGVCAVHRFSVERFSPQIGMLDWRIYAVLSSDIFDQGRVPRW